MDHWRGLQIQDILEVRYEDLIENQQTVTQMITSFAGLAWDPAFLDFQNAPNIVPTGTYTIFKTHISHC
jgi:hypothetical protein